MPPIAALGLARQVAGVFAAAHVIGIVHRDLKPDNVFLVPDSEVPGGERELVIVHDAIPGIRRTLERAAEVAMAMLSFALLGVAVQRRALTVLRRAIRVVHPGVRSAKPKSAPTP